jgi:hypothetical protein
MPSPKSTDLAPVLDRVKLALDVLAKNENRENEIETYVVTRAHAAYWTLVQAAEATELFDVEEAISDLDAAQSALASMLPADRSRFRRGVERLGTAVRQLARVLGSLTERPNAA